MKNSIARGLQFEKRYQEINWNRGLMRLIGLKRAIERESSGKDGLLTLVGSEQMVLMINFEA